MAHHQTKNTVAVTRFCNTCKRTTLHSVSGKRIGHCTEHQPEERAEKQKQNEPEQELKLF